MFGARHIQHQPPRALFGREWSILLLAILTLGIAVGPSIASAQQLNLTWVDKSGGQASFIVQRAAGVAGPYTEIARVPVGVVSHTDTAVSPGTTYCYQVAATNSTGVSPFSNAACGAPAAGFAVTVATTGTGAGAVVSSPVGITCPGTCLQSYGVGTVLTLTATPVSGSSFSGWSGGGCAGTAPCVFTGNTPVTVTAAFSLNSTAPTPSITSLSPSSVMAGSPAFSLAVTGSGFVSGATATVGGQPRTVTFGSATQMTIAVQAADVASQGSVTVQVSNPAPCAGGLCTSNNLTLTVTAPTLAPTLSSISPTSAIAGGPAFTLTATGANFTSNSVVQVNGSPRTTTFVSATQLTAAVLGGDIAAAGASSITVVTPAPGGGTSSAKTLTVLGPSLTVDSASIAPGGSVTATLTNSPGGSTDWLTMAQVGTSDTTYLQWIYVGAGVTSRPWTVTMPTTPGQYEFRFYPNNGFVRAATSPAVTVVTVNPTPSISSLSPSSVVASGAAFALTVNGNGFVSGATATVGGQPRTVTFGSATQLTVGISAADVASPGPVAVQISNPAPCAGNLCTSNSVTLSVTAPTPAPTLSSLSPSAATAGGGAFTLTAAGSNFTSNSVLRINGASRVTTFLNATQLTATVLASDIAAPGTPSITVFTPAPGGGTSAAITLSVNNPAPTLASLSPSSVSIPAADIAAAGTPSITVVSPAPGGGSSNAQMLSIAGTSLAVNTTTASPGAPLTATLSNPSGTPNDWIALAAVGAANPSYFQWTFVAALPGTTTKTWTVPLPTTPGQYEVRFFQGLTYKQTATSPTITVANINPTPSLTGLAPASVVASGPGFTLTVSGSGFVSGATATVGGQARTVTVNSPTQLSIAVIAGDVASQGNVAVQVTNPAACASGLCASNTILLGVTAPLPAPTLSSLSSSTVARGGAGFTLTATGTNFAPSSVVQLNGMSRPTSYVSPTQLTATIPASDIASARTASLTVVTPAPGGGTSNAMPLTITGPALIVSAALAPPGTSITATLSNLPGTTNDWIALAAVGAPNPTYLQYAFVRTLPGSTTKTWAFNLPVATGQYEVRFFQGLTYNRAATSPTIVVAANAAPLSPADLAPTVAVNVTSVAPGASLTATLSNLPGTANDWIALSAVGAPSPLYFQYAFVSMLPGSTTKTWTVALPTAPGQYEVRLFQGLTYNRVAISPVITVGN